MTVATDLTWDDAEEIGILLQEKFPQQNPLEVRFTDLHRMVTELPNFTGDAKPTDDSNSVMSAMDQSSGKASATQPRSTC